LSGESSSSSAPAEKIERLIDEARKAKRDMCSPATQGKEGTGEQTARADSAEGESATSRRELKEEILVTLRETSKELSRIIGVLRDEVETTPTEPQILPRYCSYCGRDLLPNALYCDRCGTKIQGV
jgi:hypothetical protein